MLPGALKLLPHPHFSAARVLVPKGKMANVVCGKSTTDFTERNHQELQLTILGEGMVSSNLLKISSISEISGYHLLFQDYPRPPDGPPAGAALAP
jgi:hypothetical protein